MTFQGARFMLPPEAAVKSQAHRFFRVMVNNGVEDLTHFNFNSQLLLQFAPQTLLERFVWVPFAARKLPQAAEVILWATLRDEQFAIAKNEAGGDFDGSSRYES